jgi:hypothetical protein
MPCDVETGRAKSNRGGHAISPTRQVRAATIASLTRQRRQSGGSGRAKPAGVTNLEIAYFAAFAL